MLSGWVVRRNDQRKLASEDARRWLNDRRQIYARYLVLVESMHREVDRVAMFLSYDGRKPITGEDAELLKEGIYEYYHRWDDELQPLLLEVQLMATPSVADLADRMSGALLEIAPEAPIGHPPPTFIEYYPGWFQAQDLLSMLRDAMREELGMPEKLSSTESRKASGWPWLESRPSRKSYVQHDPNGRHFSETEEQFLPRVDAEDQKGRASTVPQQSTTVHMLAASTTKRRQAHIGWRWRRT